MTEKKQLSKFRIFFPLAAMLAIVIIGKGRLGFNITAMLLLAAGVLGIIALCYKISWEEIYKEINTKKLYQ